MTLAAINSAEASFWIALIVVLIVLGAAGYCFWTNRIAPGIGLTVLAIISAVILF